MELENNPKKSAFKDSLNNRIITELEAIIDETGS